MNDAMIESSYTFSCSTVQHDTGLMSVCVCVCGEGGDDSRAHDGAMRICSRRMRTSISTLV